MVIKALKSDIHAGMKAEYWKTHVHPSNRIPGNSWKIKAVEIQASKVFQAEKHLTLEFLIFLSSFRMIEEQRLKIRFMQQGRKY